MNLNYTKSQARSLSVAPSIALAVALAIVAKYAHADDTKQPIHIDLPSTAVTANPLDSTLDELVPPVSVLNGRELSYQRESTLGETLNGTPGVHSSYFGPNASRPVIRGLDGDRIRLMQNGIGMIDASSLSQDHAVPIDPLAVEQIDVVRGPAALQYGGSAVGGVVNTIDNRIPRDPIDTLTGRGEARFGGAVNERSGSALMEAGNGQFALHADVYKRESDNLDIPGFARSARLRALDPQANEARGTLPNSAASGDGGALGASLTSDHGYAGLSYSEFNSNYGTVAEPGVKIDMNSSRWDMAGEERDLGEIINRVKVRLTHVDYQHQEIDTGVVGTTFKNTGWEGSMEAAHGKIGPLTGVFGLQFHNSDFSAAGDEALIPKVQTDSKATYLYEEWPIEALNRALKLSFGGRIERTKVDSAGGGPDDPNNPGTPRFGSADSRSFTPKSVSAGALYHLDSAWSIVSNLSHSERAPTYYELYTNGPHAATGQYELGDRTLSVEKSNGLDLQLRWHRGTSSFNISSFYTRFDNYITTFLTGNRRDDDGTINNLTGELPESTTQAVPAVFKGFELSSKSRVYAGVGTLDLNLKGDYVRAYNSQTGDPLPRISPMRLGFGFDYGYNRLDARLDVTRAFAQNQVAANELPTNGYTMVNAILSYHLPTTTHLDAFLKATNLLNQDAREHTSVLKDIAPLGGRAIMLGLRGEF
jgi:iron complex outermembrane receptor protein